MSWPTATTITSITSSHVVPITDGTARNQVNAQTLVASGLLQGTNATTAGNTLTIAAQSAGGTNQNGGNLLLRGGTQTGTGAVGRVQIGRPDGTGTPLDLVWDGNTAQIETPDNSPIIQFRRKGSGNQIACDVTFGVGGQNNILRVRQVLQLGDSGPGSGVVLQPGLIRSLVGNPIYWGVSDLTGDRTAGIRVVTSGVPVLSLEGATNATGAATRSIPLTPTTIAANQNDYNPGVARYYRLSASFPVSITGLAIAQVDGQESEIWNVGAANITLSHQSASSTAANRFICTGGADIVLAADEIALCRYDATTSRFRIRKV